MKDDTRRRFKDHRTRLQSEWKEEKDQAIDPLLERIKKETTETISAPTLQVFNVMMISTILLVSMTGCIIVKWRST